MGIQRYLYWFSIFKIKTIRKDGKERGFFKFLDLCEKQDGVILDIGANIGVMSYHSVNRYPERITHAFEPMPVNLEVLRKIKARYNLDQLKIHDFALGEHSGEIEMVLPQENKVTLHGLAHVVDPKMEVFNEGDKFKVRLQTLDEWMSNERIDQISGIKLDVENFEIEVLKGAVKTIQQFRPIITTELWDNQNRTDCLNFFEENNYACYGVVKEQLEVYDPSKHDTQNFILIPREKTLDSINQ